MSAVDIVWTILGGLSVAVLLSMVIGGVWEDWRN